MNTKDNTIHFKEKENKEEKKIVVANAVCPNCQMNKEGVLKIPVFDQLGVEGIRVCKNCGTLFMEKVFLDMILEVIAIRKDGNTNESNIIQ